MMSGRNRFPFTATQWQELEHQALIFKYMVSGTPIPPDLIFTVKRSLESSLSSKLILHQPPPFGWNCFQMGFGRKIDPEPGRCRRTDGKKWRCSKEAYPDSKYCERHMHRGRNRSRKPVEVIKTTTTTTTPTPPPPNPLKTPTPPPIPISSTTKNPNSTPTSSSSISDTPHHHTFLYPSSSSSKPPGLDLSSPGINTHLVLDSNPCPNNPDKDYRYGYGMKEEVVDEQQSFFSESSGTVRSYSGSSMEDDHHPWQLTPLTMGSSSSFAHLKQSSTNSGFPFLDFDHNISKQRKHFFEMPDDYDDHQKPITQKVMHHFFDEWPKNKDSWLGSEEEEDKSSDYVPISTTQLSISIPNHHSSAHRDFFMTRNDK